MNCQIPKHRYGSKSYTLLLDKFCYDPIVFFSKTPKIPFFVKGILHSKKKKREKMKKSGIFPDCIKRIRFCVL